MFGARSALSLAAPNGRLYLNGTGNASLAEFQSLSVAECDGGSFAGFFGVSLVLFSEGCSCTFRPESLRNILNDLTNAIFIQRR